MEYTPLYVKSRIFISYKYMIGLLLIVALCYWIPLLIASNFNIFDQDFGLLGDIMFYLIPVLGFLAVYVVRSVIMNIYQILPDIIEYNQKYMKMLNLQKSEKTKGLEVLLTKDGYEALINFIKKCVYSKWQYLFSLGSVVCFIIIEFGTWWNFQGLIYANKVSHPYTDIAAATLILLTIILIFQASLFLWFLAVFILTVSFFPWLNKYITQKGSGGESTQILLNIAFLERKTTETPLSYTLFYLESKMIASFLILTWIKIMAVIVIGSLMVTLNQIIILAKPNLLAFVFIIFLNLVAIATFMVVQTGMHITLSYAKTNTLKTLEQTFGKFQAQFLSSNGNDPDRLQKIENSLNILNTIIEKERQVTTWPFDAPTYIGLFATVFPAIAGFILQNVRQI